MIRYRQEERDVYAVLSFSRNELLYDIENACYIHGHMLEARDDSTFAIRHTTQDVGQKGNVDRVTRQLDLRIAEVTELLLPYSQKDISICEEHIALGHIGPHPWNDRLKETETYFVGLRLPRDFSETTLRLLENLIHEYLVARCVEDWLKICVPDKARTWTEKAEALLQDIRNAKTRPHMRRKARRPMHPF